MKVSIKKNSRGFDKWASSLSKADDQYVEIGHFAEQGKHYSGYTYAELMALYHRGMMPHQPARMLLTLLYVVVKDMNMPFVKRIAKEWRKSGDTEKMLNRIGEEIRELQKDLFGVVTPYTPPDSDGTPLYHTGQLMDKAAYRTSLNNAVKEGG